MVAVLKDVLKSVSVESGAQFVTLHGMILMLEWHVLNLGTPEEVNRISFLATVLSTFK